MTAASLISAKRTRNGLRRIKPHQDMGAVADLIEAVFRAQIDAAGRRMLREMRALSRAGAIGAFLGRIFLPSGATPLGYVWEQDGRIVGNANLLRVQGYRGHWVLANVAVEQDYRGRGIGRALSQACLDLAYAKSAQTVRLQVDRGNQTAQILYASLGFRPLATRTTWEGTLRLPRQDLVEPGRARARVENEWRQQRKLADQIHSEGLVWPFPSNRGLFREEGLLRWLGLGSTRHWVWEESGKLVGSLTARLIDAGQRWQLALIVQPQLRGRIETSLLARAAMDLHGSPRKATLEYPTGAGDALLAAWGFRAKRTLTWMVHGTRGQGG